MKKFSLVLVCIATVLGVVGFDFWSIYQAKRLILSCNSTSGTQLPQNVNQNFYFLAKGSSSSAFVSEDGQYVFKLFINKPFGKSAWREYIPLLSDLSKMRKYYRARAEKFASCHNAQKLMPKDTGLLYYHLEPTEHIGQKIALHGDHGELFKVDLDKAEYYIQKKTIVSSEYLKQAPLDQAKIALKNLLTFTKNHYKQGIVMVDLQLESNFGFIGNQPIRIDIEHLKQDPKWTTQHQKHFEEQTTQFRSWLLNNRPELISVFDTTLKIL